VETNQIEALLLKSFVGNATEDEKKLIADWISESEDNLLDWQRYRQMWEDSRELKYSGLLDVESALINTKKKIPQFGRSKKHYLRFILQAAAVLLLSILFSVTINYFLDRKEDTPHKLVYQEVKAAYGTQTKLSLEDGTRVWLNSGSTLKFPNSFNGSKNRDVELEGEGYFEVSKNASQPFIVHAHDLGIKVLGTSFNVNAYKGDSHVKVALVEGKVSVLNEKEDRAKELLQLHPSEIADYSSEEDKIYLSKEKHIDRYTAWKEGKVVFFDDPMSVMVNRLENWYNVDIEIADKSLRDYHFTATFDNESLDQILKYLSISTSFNYRFVDPSGLGGPDGGKQKIILYR